MSLIPYPAPSVGGRTKSHAINVNGCCNPNTVLGTVTDTWSLYDPTGDLEASCAIQPGDPVWRDRTRRALERTQDVVAVQATLNGVSTGTIPKGPPPNEVVLAWEHGELEEALEWMGTTEKQTDHRGYFSLQIIGDMTIRVVDTDISEDIVPGASVYFGLPALENNRVKPTKQFQGEPKPRPRLVPYASEGRLKRRGASAFESSTRLARLVHTVVFRLDRRPLSRKEKIVSTSIAPWMDQAFFHVLPNITNSVGRGLHAVCHSNMQHMDNVYALCEGILNPAGVHASIASMADPVAQANLQRAMILLQGNEHILRDCLRRAEIETERFHNAMHGNVKATVLSVDRKNSTVYLNKFC